MRDDGTISERLDADGQVVVDLLGYRMMAADIVEERSAAARRHKLAARDAAVEALVFVLASPPAAAAPWRHDLARTLRGRTPFQHRAALGIAAATATGHVRDRPEALAVLVELATFSPWSGGQGWVERARTGTLAEITLELPDVRRPDLDRVEDEVRGFLRILRRRRVRWGRVAALGVVGVGVGVATLGVAAPVIGAVIGGAAGLSGAAATSAGLALLGGGSLATGGFGVAGGTMLLAGAGGLAGGGLAAGGARAVQRVGHGLAREVVRAEVHTRIVLLEEQRDDEAARRVVVAMERRLDQVTTRLIEIATRLRELSAENAELRVELEAERARAEIAEDALASALERLPRNDES